MAGVAGASGTKRSGTPHSGPAHKKSRLDKTSAVSTKEKKVQRKTPVTSIRNDEDTDSDPEDLDNTNTWTGTSGDGGDFEEIEGQEAAFEDSDEDSEANGEQAEMDVVSDTPRKDTKSTHLPSELTDEGVLTYC